MQSGTVSTQQVPRVSMPGPKMISFFLITAAVLAAVFLFLSAAFFPCRILLFSKSPASSMPPERLSLLEERLRGHVGALAGKIGERNLFHLRELNEAADYIKRFWREQGFEVESQSYEHQGVVYQNLWVEIKGTELPEEIILAGAHYDSVMLSPGADDNASGVAALLEISRMLLKAGRFRRSIRFAAFANEEPPFFESPQRGSRVYARKAAEENQKIMAMISLESIGYFTDERDSQKYPPLFKLFYPDRGNFLAVVGSSASRGLVKKVGLYFKEGSTLPCECAAVPAEVPGVDWSDHASFWEQGFPAVMVTDTAPYRNPNYHQPGDTPETLTYPAFSRAVLGLEFVLRRLAEET